MCVCVRGGKGGEGERGGGRGGEGEGGEGEGNIIPFYLREGGR